MNPSRRRDLGAALLVALVVAASPREANAATDTLVRLEYQADEPGGCVGEDELRRLVTDQLGHDPFRPDAERRVTIRIARAEGGFHGRIVWTEADGRPVGERLLSSRSRDCHEIAANVAFAVALQLQLMERAAPKEPGADAPKAETRPPKTADQINPPPERPNLSAAPAAASPAPAGRLVLSVGAGPAVGLGIAPEATALGRLFVSARLRRLSGEIAADAALPVTQREPDGGGVVVSAMGASAAGCAHVLVVAACVLGRIGWLRARGTGVDMPSTGWARFNQVGMRLEATRDFGRFMFRVHADGLVMLAPWNVVLNDAVVWRVPRIGGVVGLDLALRFL